ncbi:hypothetical protein FisN_16Hh204 [Fistulifera solaris]|uniref:NAD-dependent epimerase/dehydratase domain-containing protein n=1 Tax=Fistulifera solaris TaxID=1519565 RepID=A0A1Z5KSR4_FISSO|nr:hypothetical protein FisN_16Hh204 [Fistulifera solaris]|eukprot:GAX29360.1 hypothetical protein FisN_16Hh204 [Fistulifera solaris]
MRHPASSNRRFSASKLGLFLLLLVGLLLRSASHEVPADALGPESVIVITGAAGFLGSELAIALYRTYRPKKIICIDSMDKGFGTLGPSLPMGIRTDQDLALFEFKRQRAFRVLQTLGVTASFYRVDLRPSIPEYYDSGEVPVLAHIFQQHSDISHVVHFADHYHRGYVNEKEQVDEQKLQIIPRIKGQPKAGMMEAILEQIKSFTKKHPERRQPHFVYASSSEIYNHKANTTLAPSANGNHDAFQPPFREQDPVTTPATLVGVSKLLDEIMARTYYEMDGIYSVGLRFFHIYGPWGLPGSPTFEMAERIVAGESPIILPDDKAKYPYAMSDLDDIRDYLYIDDAIDAVMSAMQFRPLLSSESRKSEPRPVVINVGSGQGTTLRTIGKHLVDLFPGVPQVEDATQEPPTASFASMSRVESLLGFSPRVELKDGLEQLLAWHYERTYPYGSRPAENSKLFAPSRHIASKGSISCSRYDTACLKGTPVFPCASECAHESQCIPTFWDDVLTYTRALTSGCRAVMYTIALEDDLSLLPSTVVSVSDKSHPFVEDSNGGSGNCNVAFVSERSVLYQKLLSLKGDDHIVQHGFWRLIPVHLSEHSRKNDALMLLPKLSPGLFFSVATKQAIYCDPDIILNSVPKLLKESGMQPFNEKNIRGTTAMLVGKRKEGHISNIRWNVTSWQDQVQHHAYRMVRIALVDEMSGDGFSQRIDSSLIVHSLSNDDGRLFRCDIYGEVLQWGSSSDEAAFEFISGLHDMWSRVIAKKTGHEPWWIGEEVETIDENSDVGSNELDRKGNPSAEEQRRLDETDARRLEEVEEGEDSKVDEDKATDDGVAEEADEADVDADHNGFGVPEEGVAEDIEKFPQERQERYDEPNGDDFASGDDWVEKKNGEKALPVLPKPRDPSAIDVWMGILSSTPIRSFTRIVDMEAVGAVRIDNYDDLAHGKI